MIFFTKPYSLISIAFLISNTAISQELPKIIGDKNTTKEVYLPDFSFAGYHNGEKSIPNLTKTIVLATDYGVISNDHLDDSKALEKAMEAANNVKGPVVLQLPAGKIILSDILYIERSHLVLRGTGSGASGTELFYPRPMMYVENPKSLTELRAYLLEFDKRQREKANNIDLPFSQYSWAGGYIWAQIPGERVKPYLGDYDVPPTILTHVTKGNRGEFSLEVSKIEGLNVGDVVELQLFNKDGEQGEIISDLYKNAHVKPGSNHWLFPTIPIVRQQVEITAITKNKVTIKTPLTINIKSSYEAKLVAWKHLEEVGIENLRMSFPDTSLFIHHVEQGNNAIFLTRVFNSWVQDIVINNAESGILTEEIANVTIKNIVTEGKNLAHYTMAMGAVHNVLVSNLKIYNHSVHALSFNTFSTKNVYQHCEVFVNPVLDQHSGANHQNLFDNITVHLNPLEDNSYPLFAGGGASYWKPSHGAYSTFWNINVQVKSKFNRLTPVKLNGMNDGPFARIIGVHGNGTYQVDYEPNAYMELINESLESIPSLYNYQLNKRLK